MQRIGESRWRPLELCWLPGLPALSAKASLILLELPAKGKEYPELGNEWLQNWPPKAQQQQQREALWATRPADWKPPAGQEEHRLVRPAWSQQRDQPVRGLMWCPVVAPRKPPQAPCSSQAATQPAASEPGPSTPMPAKRSKRIKAEPAAEPTQPTKGKGKAQGKAAKAKPAPQPGRWVDMDCNAALNMQHIGESRWRPLELCYWPEEGKLPAKGKEYPGLGYKRVRDKPPEAQQQQQSAVVQ
ncbi:hypothetical protein QJQ45_002432 [Haematococcus lacustris]|nr:hypothetical protein QJQ45_002432 [Haematococcus lacustris]